ncbi:MAG TPA: triose-phosphate isomerase [Sphingobacteriaceae bacterium]|nr:triose-phosphate isomerase [Sphingobacteriaceae bacterium]
MSRIPLIAANWKMNLTHTEAAVLAKAIVTAVGTHENCEVLLCPPFTSLAAVSSVLLPGAAHGPVGHYGAIESAAGGEGSGGDGAGGPAPGEDGAPAGAAAGRDWPGVRLGAQNAHWETSGAFTGEVSVPMLRALGCRYVIIGHSERRHIFGEDDEMVARKLKAVYDGGLVPILCVGETLAEREAGRTEEVIGRQVDAALAALQDLDQEAASTLVIAYEPVWAIGTGQAARPEDAAAAAGFIRSRVAQGLGAPVAGAVRILYGGSVNAENAGQFLGRDDIDGALVGGASLKADSFAAIVAAVPGGQDP